MRRFAYLHGFGSSPKTHKGVVLAAAMKERGLELERPALRQPSFEKLSMMAALAEIDAMDARVPAEPWCLAGSSLGGWMAAYWAQMNPAKVEKLVLLCPAFDLATRWPKLVGPAMMERWKSQGSLPFLDHSTGKEAPVHYRFFEEGQTLPGRPVVPCPTLIFHGRRDPTVPIESSRSYAAEHSDRVTLVELDDVHELVASLSVIIPRTLEFFGVER